MTIQTDWCISDADQWIADLDDPQFAGEEPAPAPARKPGERYQEDTEIKFDYINDDNEILELVALILTMTE